jgi:hypothetical protein
MIEVFDSRARHMAHCGQRERLAAEAAHHSEAKMIHELLARMYEREAIRTAR